MEKMNDAYAVTRALYAEMIWDEAIRKYREQLLYSQIDGALAQGDAEAFYALTSELKLLLS
ncbi:IDEAL domain-containing protein [Paenibacillus sp. y28]|uniref:IDEAL domain-containing protein n=1 Tax=Paenibacillus sp. y28 TaxID=3129110 RepID=UPI00301B1469